jgi:hypothetical protein
MMTADSARGTASVLAFLTLLDLTQHYAFSFEEAWRRSRTEDVRSHRLVLSKQRLAQPVLASGHLASTSVSNSASTPV